MDEDAGLVESAKAGDYAAFEALVGKYECRMFGLAVGILQRCEDAEDAVQRTFLSVVEHLKDFRGEAAFRTWLTRIATNHALEILRKRRGLSTVPFEESPSGEDETRPPFPEFVASWRENPERLASRAETGRLLQEALAAIPDAYRTVFLLRDVEGLSVAETAAALGITAGNVKVRLLRARLKLREKLTRDFGDPATRVEVRQPHEHGL
jgi:RNA polymerase sigma-70 factor (ECF subfamily)